MGLNWNDTKVFQNPNHKQFDKVEDITKLYLKSPDSQYAVYPVMLVNPWAYAQHYRYVKLKDGRIFGSLADMVKGADNVLMANDKDKVIAIHDYLKWLNCHYDIDLNSTVKDAPHLPADIDVYKDTNRE